MIIAQPKLKYTGKQIAAVPVVGFTYSTTKPNTGLQSLAPAIPAFFQNHLNPWRACPPLHPVTLFNCVTHLAHDCVCFCNFSAVFSFQLFLYLVSCSVDLAALPDSTIGSTLTALHIPYTAKHHAIYYELYAQ